MCVICCLWLTYVCMSLFVCLCVCVSVCFNASSLHCIHVRCWYASLRLDTGRVGGLYTGLRKPDFVASLLVAFALYPAPHAQAASPPPPPPSREGPPYQELQRLANTPLFFSVFFLVLFWVFYSSVLHVHPCRYCFICPVCSAPPTPPNQPIPDLA